MLRFAKVENDFQRVEGGCRGGSFPVMWLARVRG